MENKEIDFLKLMIENKVKIIIITFFSVITLFSFTLFSSPVYESTSVIRNGLSYKGPAFSLFDAKNILLSEKIVTSEILNNFFEDKDTYSFFEKNFNVEIISYKMIPDGDPRYGNYLRIKTRASDPTKSQSINLKIIENFIEFYNAELEKIDEELKREYSHEESKIKSDIEKTEEKIFSLNQEKQNFKKEINYMLSDRIKGEEIAQIIFLRDAINNYSERILREENNLNNLENELKDNRFGLQEKLSEKEESSIIVFPNKPRSRSDLDVRTSLIQFLIIGLIISFFIVVASEIKKKH